MEYVLDEVNQHRPVLIIIYCHQALQLQQAAAGGAAQNVDKGEKFSRRNLPVHHLALGVDTRMAGKTLDGWRYWRHKGTSQRTFGARPGGHVASAVRCVV